MSLHLLGAARALDEPPSAKPSRWWVWALLAAGGAIGVAAVVGIDAINAAPSSSERARVLQALRDARWKTAAAAERARLGYRTFLRRMHEYSLPVAGRGRPRDPVA